MTARPASLTAPGLLTRVLSARIPLTAEVGFYAAVFAVAIALRFWDLGSRAYHHDESIHAKWAWDLIRGNYRHSPIFHGPFYYHVQGFVFLIAGATDYLGRVTPALFGTVMVASPLLLRRQLGPAGTMAAVALLAVSPTLVYFSRFLREDIYVAVFVLGMIIGIARYLEDGRLRWLALLGGSFTGAVLTKEGAFITTGVILLFLNLVLAAELGAAAATRTGREPSAWARGAWSLALFPVAWAVAALWPLLGRVRESMDWPERLPRTGDALVLLGTFTLPLLTPVSRHYLLEPLGLVEVDRLSWQTRLDGNPSASDISALVGLFAITTSLSAFAGLNWRPRFWALLFTVCAAVYLTLMTSFWTNLDGLISGPWGSLDYWITQQDEARGDQPWFYYYMVMSTYEFLPLALALGGTWWALARGSTFSRLLVFWAAGQWLTLSYASEKMPWNNVHITVPVCLLAAWTVQYAWANWPKRPPFRESSLFLVGVAAITAGSLVLVAWPPEPLAGPLGRLSFVIGGGVLVLVAAWPLGRRAVPTILIAAAIGGLSLFTVRTTVMASFVRADDPRDLLIYTQSSGHLADIARDIDRLAAVTGKGHDLRIAVDARDSFAWPWAWYLRDYRGVGYPDLSDGNTSLAEYDVILVNAANLDAVNTALGNTPGGLFAEPERYPHRWWFDETYKSAMDVGNGLCTALSGDCGPWRPKTWSHIAGHVVDGSWVRAYLSFVRDHDPGRPNGSVDAYALFPAAFDRESGLYHPAPSTPVGPTLDEAGRLTVGSWGTAPGQFLEPIDVAVDAAGNVYVMDRASRRVQKFDAQGTFVAQVDVRNAPGDSSSGSDPWGLGVSSGGDVYVADTFGYRVRVFSPALEPVLTFGETTDLSDDPGPLELFGPRDIAVDPDGNLWVTDTGHDRIVVYRADGTFVRQVGGSGDEPGRFNEPIGIAMAGDGTVIVGDMWNARVQILSLSGDPLGEFPVEGWGGEEAIDKPYLAALPDGRIAVGLPLRGEVRVYRRDGTVDLVIGAEAGLDRPYGLAATADGRLWIAEGGSRRVRLFEIP